MKRMRQITEGPEWNRYGTFTFHFYTAAHVDGEDDATYDKFQEIMGQAEEAIEKIPTTEWAYHLEE